MKSRIITLISLVYALAPPLVGQDQEVFQRLPLRVTQSGPGEPVMIDRGKRDGVAVGDLVMILPRGGTMHRGSVIQLDDRSALVELGDKTYVPPPGTPGEVLVPRARLQKDPVVPPVVPPPGQGDPVPDPTAQDPGREPWKNQDEGFKEGMPLLAQVRPVRPEQRTTSITGRAYLMADLVDTSREDLDNSLFRVGTDFNVENPFGWGGGIRSDVEFNYKTEVNQVRGADLLVRRLSYYHGGTRFAPNSWEVGRFLQTGMPEFGVLDGVEYRRRTTGGHRFGFSFGYLPELNDDFQSLRDLQFSGHFLYSVDELEQLVFGLGYQKSWHNGRTDRDLVVAKVRYLPLEGWDFFGTFWVDFYYGRDDLKKNAVELTQALVTLGRRWDTGNGLEFAYRRILFPDMLRAEFLPPQPNEITGMHLDRLSFSGWRWVTDDTRFHGFINGWNSEADNGAAADVGLDIQDVFLEESRLDVTLFGSLAEYTTVVGARASYGRYTSAGRWDVMYEIANHRNKGFPSGIDDILQQRIRASHVFNTEMGWDLNVWGEAQFWDETEWSWSLGLLLQKSF